MPFRLSEYIPEQTVLKELLLDFYKTKVCGGVRILIFVGMYSFTGELKTPVLLFQKIF